MTTVSKSPQGCLRSFCVVDAACQKWLIYKEQRLISCSFGTQAAQERGFCMLPVHVLCAIPLAEGRRVRENLRPEEAELAW